MSIDPKQWAWGAILSVDPLIQITKRSDGSIFGPLLHRPEYFADRDALHLVGFCWSIESQEAVAELAADLDEACRRFPRSHFVFLTNSEFESYLLSRSGIPSLFANELIFTDEKNFRPIAGVQAKSELDAYYNARFDPGKRHELCRSLDSVAFVYGQYSEEQKIVYSQMRELLPQARFLNHELGGGEYAWMSVDEINMVMNQCRTGLCLSSVEGAMRASMECLLAGLPIISTESTGGRDRYYTGPYCSIVPADPDAVAYGVRRMIERNFKREHIREHVGQLLAFDRYNFLLNLNKIIHELFGVDHVFKTFEPFVGSPISVRTVDEVFAEADEMFGQTQPVGK